MQLNAGKPVVAYTRDGDHVMLATCTANCTTATPTWVIAPVTFGNSPSLQIIAGKPVVSYVLGNAIYLESCTANCETPAPNWSTTKVLDTGGYYHALGQVNGNPVVAYADVNLQEVVVATCTANCAGILPTWARATIVKKQPGDMYFVGQVALAVVGSTPWVSYERGFIGGSDLTVVTCTAGCGSASATWSGSTVDVPLQGHTLQLQNGQPAVAYYSFPQFNQDLKYAVCTADCSSASATWTKGIVESSGNTGRGASLQFVGGLPVISFIDGAGKLKLAKCSAGCASDAPAWAFDTVDDGDGAGQTSLVISGSLALATYRVPSGTYLRLAAAVVAPDARLTPTSLSFGLQSMGTSADPRQATLDNTGGMPIVISSIVGSNPEFTWSHDCPASLAPAQSCRITAVYAPPIEPGQIGASHTDQLLVTITDNAPGSPRVVVFDGLHDKSLVPHYYRKILRRAPDQAGYNFWIAEAMRTQDLLIPLDEVWFAMAQTFYFSPEYAAFNRDNSGFVTDMYRTFFNREPDPDGLAFWVDQRVNGLPREVMLSSFLFSPEFASFTQNVFPFSGSGRAEARMVADFYRGLLVRLPDDAGFNYWRGRFRTAQCSGAAAVANEVEAISKAFTDSGEYAARARSNVQYVGDLYNAFLRRGGDINGVQFWVDQVATSARTRDQVRIDFKNSAEFQARVNAVVQQGCMQ